MGEVIYWPAAGTTGMKWQYQEEQGENLYYYDLRGVRHQEPQQGINIVNWWAQN